MLIGLAAKNAILIVEFAKERSEEGKDLVTAALEGAQLRLRPILMTSFAFILGCVPLWIAAGSGAASRRILGTVVDQRHARGDAARHLPDPDALRAVEKLATGRSRSQAAGADAVAEAERVMMKRLFADRRSGRRRPLLSGLRGRAELREADAADAGRDPRRRAARHRSRIRRRQLVGGVPGRAAAGAGPHGAQRRTTTCSSPRRACWKRRRSSASRARISTRPSAPKRGAGGGRTSAASARRRRRTAGAMRVGGTVDWELDFWGRYRRATESARGAAAGDRVGTPRRG